MSAELATENLEELAQAVTAVAELQNLVSLAVAAVVVRRLGEERPEGSAQAGCNDDLDADSAPGSLEPPTQFLDDRNYQIVHFTAPKRTPALANARFEKDQFWLFSISGGVEIDPESLAENGRLKP